MADVKSNYPPLQKRTTPRDPYDRHREELDSPASSAFNITPSQSLLDVTIRGLYIGGTGNVFCRVAFGNTTHRYANVFFHNVQAGTILPVRMDGVFTYNPEAHDGAAGAITATGGNSAQNTNATFLVGLY